MSTNAKKPAAPGNNLGRRPSTDPSLNSNSPARRSPTPSSSPSTNGVIARTRSIRGGVPIAARADIGTPPLIDRVRAITPFVEGDDEGVGERRAGEFELRDGSVEGRRPRLLPGAAGFLAFVDMVML